MDQSLHQRIHNQIFKFEGSFPSAGGSDTPFTLDYEDGEYRQEDLIGLIRDVVPYFSLTEAELNNLDKSDWNKTAFTRISDAAKEKQGDYGELLLFLLLSIFFDAPKFVTKARLRSTTKEQIKGFDCAHFSVDPNNEVSLWLGEAKFHKKFSTAVAKALSSLNDHLNDSEKIKSELKLLGGEIEINKGIPNDTYNLLKSYVSGGKSLDKVQIVSPVLITYDSTTVKKFCGTKDADIASPEFKSALETEINKKFSTISTKNWPKKKNIKIIFFIMPFSCVKSIKSNLAIVEQGMKF